MRYSYASKLLALWLGVAFLVLPTSGVAKDGHDFSGIYSVSQVNEQQDGMVVSLSLQLFNHSDSDIQKAVVVLRPTVPSPNVIGNFRTVKLWRNGGEVRLTQEFTISRLEYDRWQQNGQPQLFVSYRDASGQQWERFVQVAPRSAIK
jgi:hypothetical protein